MEKNYYNMNRSRSGCLPIIYAAVILAICICLSSCATKKQVCGVTDEIADTLDTSLQQTTAVSVLDEDSIYKVTEYDKGTFDETTTTSDDTEVINTHTVETIDSAGNRTITTDTSINRRKQSAQHQTNSMYEHERDELSQKQLSRIDSLYEDILNRIENHQQRKDSINENFEQNTSNTRPWWSIFVDYLKLLYVLILIAIVIFAWKYVKGK